MIAVQVARIIASFVVFLNLTEEESLNLDNAVKMMEELAGDMEMLEKPFLREVIDAFAVVALEYSGEARQLVLDIPSDFYLEEALAEDDPVRLAELEALRDARDAEFARSEAAKRGE